MQNVTNPTVKTHVVWLDVVRLIAMFTVVCCHCTDPFNFYPGDSPIIGNIKFWGAAYGAFLRPCVPLFVMITGALLLPVREETSIFYKKRILRVFWRLRGLPGFGKSKPNASSAFSCWGAISPYLFSQSNTWRSWMWGVLSSRCSAQSST